MSASVEIFYRSYIEKLVAVKQADSVAYEQLFEELVSIIKKDVEYAQKMDDIVSDLKFVGKKLQFVNDSSSRRAREFYREMPPNHGAMGDCLIEAFEEMELAVRNEDFKRASKYVMVQLEIIIAYLIKDFKLIDEISKDKKMASDYELEGSQEKGFYLKLDAKIRLAISYCGATEVDKTLIDVVRSVRDTYSHGYHEDDLKKLAKSVDKVANEHSRYFRECFKLIKAIKLKLYDLFKSLVTQPKPTLAQSKSEEQHTIKKNELTPTVAGPSEVKQEKRNFPFKKTGK